MQRCFIAWVPDPATREALAGLQRVLRAERTDPGHRWIDVDKLHLTLRFLGDTTKTQLDAIMRATQDVAESHAACAAAIAGWRYWPDGREPRVLVLQIDSCGALEALGVAAEACARATGFAPERRPFRTHLTLARVGRLRQRPAPMEGVPPSITFSVDHMALVQSTLHPSGGSSYSELARWPLRSSDA